MALHFSTFWHFQTRNFKKWAIQDSVELQKKAKFRRSKCKDHSTFLPCSSFMISACWQFGICLCFLFLGGVVPLLLLLLWGLWVRHPEGESKSTTTQEQEGGSSTTQKERGREGGGEGEWGKQHRQEGPPLYLCLSRSLFLHLHLCKEGGRKQKHHPRGEKQRAKEREKVHLAKGERRRLHHSHKRNDTQSTNARENPQERNFLLNF